MATDVSLRIMPGLYEGRNSSGSFVAADINTTGRTIPTVFDIGTALDTLTPGTVADPEQLASLQARRAQLRELTRKYGPTPADALAAFQATIATYERLIRARPEQWLLFQDVWRDAVAAAEAPEEAVPGPGRTAAQRRLP